MNNYRDIIVRPIITEKTMKMMESDNKVAPCGRQNMKTPRHLRKRRFKIHGGSAPCPPQIRATRRLPKIAMRNFAESGDGRGRGIGVGYGRTAQRRRVTHPARIKHGAKPARIAAFQGRFGKTDKFRLAAPYFPRQFLERTTGNGDAPLKRGKHLISARLPPLPYARRHQGKAARRHR